MNLKTISNFALLLVLGLFLSTCDDNPVESGTDLSPEEAKQKLEQSVNSSSSKVEQAVEGAFMSTVENFAGSDLQQEPSLEWTFPMFEAAADVINVDQIESNHRFDFQSNTGLYEWNAQDSVWDESSSDDIIFRFPASEQATQNNMSLALREYADAMVTIEGEDYYLPTQLLLEIARNETAHFRFDLNNLQFIDDPDITIPSAVDLQILTVPALHTFTFSLDNTDFSLSYESAIEEMDDGRIWALDVNGTLAHDNYNNLDEEDYENVSGNLHLGTDVRIDYDIDVGTLAGMDNPSENDINSNMKAEVFYNDTKIGDIEYRDQVEQLVIVYEDDSTEPVQKFVTQYINTVQDNFSSTAAKTTFNYVQSLTR